LSGDLPNHTVEKEGGGVH